MAGTAPIASAESRPAPDAPPTFHLLETLLWRRKSGFFLRHRHVERAIDSARFFARPLDHDGLHQILEQIDGVLRRDAESRHRVRLLIDERGGVEWQAHAFPCSGRQIWTATLDDRPVDSRDPFLRHKTTHRRVYEQAMGRWPEVDDVILFNERGELTESTRANLILELDGEWWTPALECGLLAGTYRAELLERGRLREAVLTRERLAEATSIRLINSLRGFIRVVLESRAAPHFTASGSSSST